MRDFARIRFSVDQFDLLATFSSRHGCVFIACQVFFLIEVLHAAFMLFWLRS